MQKDPEITDLSQLEKKLPDVVTEHRFISMIVFSIVIAGLLVVVAMWMYNWSGAAQVDLSRPEYQSVRNKATINKTSTLDDAFPATGAFSESAIKEFRDKYAQRIKAVKNSGAFERDPLSDESLFSSETAGTVQQ